MTRDLRSMALNPELETALAAAEARISWVLQHPHMSAWLKDALRTAEGLEPVVLRNDVEILAQLIGALTQVQVEIAIASAGAD
jgi:hypothetical protein